MATGLESSVSDKVPEALTGIIEVLNVESLPMLNDVETPPDALNPPNLVLLFRVGETIELDDAPDIKLVVASGSKDAALSLKACKVAELDDKSTALDLFAAAADPVTDSMLDPRGVGEILSPVFGDGWTIAFVVVASVIVLEPYTSLKEAIDGNEVIGESETSVLCEVFVTASEGLA